MVDLKHGTGPVFTDDTGTRATASRRVMRGLCGLIALGVVAVVLSAALHITLPGLDHPLSLPGTKPPSSPAPRVSKNVGRPLPTTDRSGPVTGPATGAAPSPVAAGVATAGPAAPSPVAAALTTAGPTRRTPTARSSATPHPRPASPSTHPSAASPTHPVAASPTHPVAASPTHPAAASPTHPVAASPTTRPRVAASGPALPSPTRKLDHVIPASPSGTPVAVPTR